MYEIELTTWYQETPEKQHKGVYNNIEFNSIKKASKFLFKNIDSIVDNFPIISIAIKLK